MVLIICLFFFQSSMVMGEEKVMFSDVNAFRNSSIEQKVLFLSEYGFTIPNYYLDNLTAFNSTFESACNGILSGIITPTCIPYSSPEQCGLVLDTYMALSKSGLLSFITPPSVLNPNMRSNYSPSGQHDVYGSYYSGLTNFNCYAYAIGQSSAGQVDPGDFSTDGYYPFISITSLVSLVESDLSALGFWSYHQTSKPTSLPDQYFKVICVRKNASGDGYHFMKMNGSLSSWTHKPGQTMILSWRSTSPSTSNYPTSGTTYWTDEYYVYNYGWYGGTYNNRYSGTIYYILYKSLTDPGIGPQDIKIPGGVVNE